MIVSALEPGRQQTVIQYTFTCTGHEVVISDPQSPHALAVVL